MTRRRVVVTGLGAITPLGNTVDTYWNGLLEGRSGIDTIRRFSTEGFDVRIGGECGDFDPVAYVDRKALRRLDRFAQFAIAAAMDAGKDAKIEAGGFDPDRAGVIVGSGIGGLSELEQQHVRLLEKGADKVSAFTIPKLMLNAASGHISILFGLCGPVTAVATACASATNAMGDAYMAIRRGDVDLMFTGGAEAALTPLGLAAFASMKALSARNDDPLRASRPFDKDRDGFVLGEGGGILVFEELEHARRRGVHIYGEVLGFGTSADASDIVQPQEEGIGAAKAMVRALRDAEMDVSRVAYINAHGTSTPLGDIAETLAVKAVFGQYAHKVAVSSTKSATGHLLGASGAVEMIATIKAIEQNIAPPTINLDQPDEKCDLDYVPLKARPMTIDVAMCNSFGFGGHNASMLIGRFTD